MSKKFLKDRMSRQNTRNPEAGFLALYPPPPKTIMIETTNACNHRCLFCANKSMVRKKGFNALDTYRRIIREAHNIGVREIGLYSTGESFLHKELPRMVVIAKEMGYEYIYLTTNGALPEFEQIHEVLSAGLQSIKFSINAGSRSVYETVHGKDDFERVVERLAYVCECKEREFPNLLIGATFVVMDENRDDQDAARGLFEKYCDDYNFWPVIISGGNIDLPGAQPFFKYPCNMIFNRAHITWEGYMTLCCIDFNGYLVVADCSQMTFGEAWHSEAATRLRQMHLDGNGEGTLCAPCITGNASAISPLLPKVIESAGEKHA